MRAFKKLLKFIKWIFKKPCLKTDCKFYSEANLYRRGTACMNLKICLNEEFYQKKQNPLSAVTGSNVKRW